MSWHTKENYDLSEYHPRKQLPNGHGQHTVITNFLIQAAVSIEQFSTLRIIQKFLEQFFSQWVRTILETKYILLNIKSKSYY